MNERIYKTYANRPIEKISVVSTLRLSYEDTAEEFARGIQSMLSMMQDTS